MKTPVSAKRTPGRTGPRPRPGRAGAPWLVLVALCGAAHPVRAQAPASVEIAGEMPRPYRLTSETMSALGPAEVAAREHGGDLHRYRGVPLRAVLERGGVEFGGALRGPKLATYVLIEAADGYRVTFSLASLDEAFGAQKVFLADRMDDQPLMPEQGPFRLVVPGDERPARWARQVVRITVQSPPGGAER